MRTAIAALVASAAAAASGAAHAQAAAPTPDIPMAGVVGYGHPAIGPNDCKVINPSQAVCTIPAKTAGSYLVVASGTSTATGAGAAQQITIGGNNWVCAKATTSTTAGKWTSGPRTLQAACMIEVLTDQPLPVGVVYADVKADKDPKGPTLKLTAAPWNGIIASTYLGAGAK